MEMIIRVTVRLLGGVDDNNNVFAEGTPVDFPTTDRGGSLPSFNNGSPDAPLGTPDHDVHLKELLLAIKNDDASKVRSMLTDIGDFNVRIPEPRRRSTSTCSNPGDYSAPYEDFWSPPVVLAVRLGSPHVLSQLVDSKKCDINATDQRGQTALHYAVKKHRSEAVKMLLDNGADPNLTTPAGNTALILACSLPREDPDIVRYILKHTSDVNARRYLGKTALSIAATRGHAGIVRILVEQGASLQPEGFTFDEDPFVDACRSNHLEVVQFLMDILNKDLSQATLNRALMAAVSGGADLELVRLLVARGASVDAPSAEYQHTAVMEAIRCCRWRVLRFFFGELGADVNARDARGRTALHYSTEYSDHFVPTRTHPSAPEIRTPTELPTNAGELAVKLYRQGYDPFAFNKLGFSPVHLACMNGVTALVKAVLDDFPEKVDFKDGNKKTPISYAVVHGNLDTVKCLLTFHPNLDQIVDESGMTLLHATANSHHPHNVNIAKALIESGCNVNAVDIIGQNAIHYAVSSCQVDVLDCLIKEGVSPDRVSQKHGAPIHIASKYGFSQVVEKLLDTELVSVRQTSRPSFRPPLILATREGHLECMKVLLEHDHAGVHIRCPEHMTALDHYIQEGPHDLEVIQLLLDYGFDVRKYLRVSVLSYMIKNRYDRAVVMLLEAGASVEKVHVTDSCPLWEALCMGNLPVAKCLLKAGCPVGDCFQLALKRRYMGACWCLYQAGAGLHILHQGDHQAFLEKAREQFEARNWQAHLDTLSELKDLAQSPRNLQGICRLAVRKILGKDPHKQTASLPLPESMRNYVLFKDLDDITYI